MRFHTGPRRSVRAVSILLVLLVTALALACGDRGATSADNGRLSMPPVAKPSPAPVADFAAKYAAGLAPGRRSAAEESRVGEQPAAPLPTQAVNAATSMIIRNGDVSVQVDSLEAAIAAVRRLAAALGGYIGNVSTNTGQREIRAASLEMKIPAARFDEAMSGMIPLGKVEHSSATAQDVGEEFVDVTARIANAKRLETRLVGLLATRTGKLDDVLAVERELARVRGEIERYEGRIRYLSAHVATSTIVATVHEKAPIVAVQPGTNPLRQAFVNMWRNFVFFLAWSIEALGVVIPVAVIALAVLIGWRRWKRTRVVATAA